jgi:hypothetical protein
LSRSSIVFHPLTILLLSITATLVLALVIMLLFDGERCTAILAYSVPIAVPFVAYLFDRAQRWPEIRWTLDVPVILLALSRAFVPVPLISGHALFLTYAVLTTHLPIARWTALLMLLYVIYLKAFVWQDTTLIGGLALGIAASLVWRKTGRKRVQ